MKLRALLLALTAFAPCVALAQVTPSSLPPATTINNSDTIIVDQGVCSTCTRKATVQQLQAGPLSVAAQAVQTANGAVNTVSGATNTAQTALNTANTTSSSLTAEIARALAAEATKLALSGGTLTGPLTLSADPSSALQAATKQYIDNHSITTLPGYVDPTNAGNIASGTLNIARLPALSTSTITEGSNLYFTTGRAANAAPVQSVATLTGSPTAAQLAAQLGGTDAMHLAFGNDSRIVGAVQTSSIGAAPGVAGTDSAGCVLYSSAVKSCTVSGVLEFLTIP